MRCPPGRSQRPEVAQVGAVAPEVSQAGGAAPEVAKVGSAARHQQNDSYNLLPEVTMAKTLMGCWIFLNGRELAG